MFSNIETYFIDLAVIYKTFPTNFFYLFKLLIVTYFVFYWIPTKVFPQEFSGKGVQKIVYNFIYMTAYVEVFVTLFVFIKAFSLFLFFLSLIVTKFAFLKWYYKKDIIKFLDETRVKVMLNILDSLDNPRLMFNTIYQRFYHKFIVFQQHITLYSFLQKTLFISVFVYIIGSMMIRGLYSYADPTPDTSQFIEWVTFLQKNILYWPGKTFGADFYGISIMIFFVNMMTNIDIVILFSIYPVLLLLALYFAIYFVIKEFSGSKYVAIFAVMIHGIIFMSPLSNFFLGKIVNTFTPDIVHFFSFSFYFPPPLAEGVYEGFSPYIRYISGMAYEHSSVFVLLNAYFLIKTLNSHLTRDLILYTLTLMLVFTFHGGGAIILLPISLLIALNALMFRKIDLYILKRGILSVTIAVTIGNAWILSMLMYGIPEEFGAAAPFIDKLLGPTHNFEGIPEFNIETVTLVAVTKVHLILAAMLFIALIFSFFTKKRFLNSSILLISVGIFLVYFGPNLGLPLLAKHGRTAEYMFIALTILFAFYYLFLFYKPLFLIFKKYARYLILGANYILFLSLVFIFPSWLNEKILLENINNTEYTSIPANIMKIKKENRPFTWTVVSYIQEYAKVKNKGYHLNTQNFLLEYSPTDKYLKVPTQKVYIFVEDFPHPYRGMDEWFYRWRDKIQDNLKSWIALYSMFHNNIRLYAKSKTVTVYEIDNSEYIEYLRKKDKK